jgi:hypothetical protein
LFSSYCAYKRSPIRRLDSLCAELLVLLACCALVALSGCGFAPNGSATGPLRVSPSIIIFGSVPVGQTVTTKVSLVNATTSPVQVSQLNVAGQNFFVNGQSNLPVTISVGGSYSFDLGFKPGGVSNYTGQFSAMDGANEQLVQVSISGVGVGASGSSSTPGLTVSAAKLAFGNVPVGTTSTRSVTLTSTGSAPVTISSAALTGPGFTMSGATFPVTLNPKQSATLSVQFDPTAAGAAAGRLQIQSDSATSSTAVVNLSGMGTAAAAVSSPQLTVSAASLIFGDVTVGSASTQPVTLKSTGTAPVTINSAVLTGSGFTLSRAAFPVNLNPGQSVTLHVRFDPTTRGAAAGQLTIESDSSTNSTAVINLSGMGTAVTEVSSPQLTISAASLTFGSVTVNTASTQPVTLTSTGTAPVTITSAALAGTGFTMSGATLPVTLNPNQSVTLNVRFEPTSTGAVAGHLTIQSNSSSNSTAVLNLSGTGTATVNPQLTVSSASLTFGNVTVDTASTQPVTLTSTGTAPATISSAALTGTGFAMSGATLPVTLKPNQSVTLNVKFDPRAAGAATGQLRIQSNSSTNGVAVVNLSGTGTAMPNPQLTVSAASLTFGNVTVDTASTQPVTLTSTGTAPVTISSAALTGTGFTMSGATLPVTLNPNQSVTLNVKFDPTATGEETGQLTIQSNSSTNSTADVSLSGTGTPMPNPQLTISTASLTFGNVTVDTASTQPVTLTSTGTAPVTISSAALAGTGFTMSGATLPVTLNPNQSVTLNVQFDPAATGAVTGGLTIQSDSSTNSTAVVNLSGTGAAASNPQLTISAASLTFGNVTVDTASTQPVTLTSTGTAPVTISSAALTGTGFTMSGATLPLTLNPNQSVTLSVQFDPATTGAVTGGLTIQSNSSTNSTAVVSLSGTGTVVSNPQLTVSAASLTFGNVTVNTASTQSVTLTSTGMAPVTISSAALTGTGFTMSGVTLPATLNPSQSVTLNVQFDPTATGVVTGGLTIQSNSSTNSTAVVNLSGTGTAVSNPQLTISTASLTFGNVTVNTPSTQPVTLTSTGTAPVTINSAALTGTGFTISGATLPVTLNPTQSVTLNVQFDPTATGTVTGGLTIQSNSSTNSTAVVNLSGTGTAVLNPQLTISTASLTFGNVTVNTASTQPVTLTSTGTAPVTISSAALTGTGFTISGATLPVTLNPTQSVTLNVQFDPTATGAVTGGLTIQSNSSTGATAVVSLTGTGTAALAALSALSCSSGSMTGSGSDNCTVTLTGAAASSGFSVSLASSNAAVVLPATVMVPANATSAGFVASVSAVTSAQAVTLTATAGSVSKSFALQLSAATPTLTISPASVSFGNVTVNTASTQPVTLSSTGTAPVTINSGTLTGTGFTMSGATFPVTLNPGLAVTLEMQFDPAATGAATGQLTIQSNSSTNSSVVISLSGTGQSASHQADLSWQAPSSSADPVVGYNIYRSAGGSSAYQLLNSSPDAQTTYVDNTIQGGSTYDYYVTSVDSSGVESVASNEVSATVP